MDRVKLLEHQGKRIVYIDFSNITKKDQEVLYQVIDEAKSIIKTFPPYSALTLVNFSGLHFNTDMIEALKEFTVHNKPFVKAGAVFGIEGLQLFAYKVVMKFAGRNLPVFEGIESAKEYLISL